MSRCTSNGESDAVPTNATLRLPLSPWHIRNNRSLRTCTSYLSSESKAKELLTKDILDGKVTTEMTPTTNRA